VREDGALAYKLQSQESKFQPDYKFLEDCIQLIFYFFISLQLTTFIRAIGIGMRWCAKISPRLCMNKLRKQSRPNVRWRPIEDASLNSNIF